MIELLTNNPLYVVLTIVLIIWFAIYFYLYRLDNRMKKIEQQRSQH